MRISDVARALGADPATIRYYEAAGILPPPRRAANGYRDYRTEDVHRIELVLALRRLRVPLDDIRSLVGTCFDHRCPTSTRRLVEVIDRRSAQVDRQMEALRRLADRYADLRRRLTNEGSTSMVIEHEITPAIQSGDPSNPSTCDCGCTGSTCDCGCACCVAGNHVDHQRAVEILAEPPRGECSCGCCG